MMIFQFIIEKIFFITNLYFILLKMEKLLDQDLLFLNFYIMKKNLFLLNYVQLFFFYNVILKILKKELMKLLYCIL